MSCLQTALALSAIALPLLCTPAALGHGVGLDTIPSVDVGGREVSVAVEIPSYEDGDAAERRVAITATDRQTKEGVPNVTYVVGVFRDGGMVFRDRFFAGDGRLLVDARYSDAGPVVVSGGREPALDAWRSAPGERPEVTGPVFGPGGGLYTFEIEIKTAGEPAEAVEGAGVHTADVTIVGEASFPQKDAGGNDVWFGTRSYFDSIDSFAYDPAAGTVEFEMPFDWSERRSSHVPVVHEEVRFPKWFAEFLAPSYTGRVNGVDLFRSSVTVDDYTEDSERIVHFVLLQDHIRHIKNQLRQAGAPPTDRMVFTLQASEEVAFPVSAWTRDESLQVDLSWDPAEIAPGQTTKFIFTIRDAATAEPLRNSGFDFVLLQGGEEIHRQSGNAQIGGDFVDYTFAGGQTGPTTIRFEDIRGTGLSTEFGVAVVPEFGLAAPLALAAGAASAALLTRLRPPGAG